MATVKRFEELMMFQKARELTREVYKALSACRPPARCTRAGDDGFRDQIHPVRSSPPLRPFGRASAGATSNGVQGIAKASAGEVRAQTYVGYDVGYLNIEKFKYLNDLAEQCSRLIASFIAKLKSGGMVGTQYKREPKPDLYKKFLEQEGYELLTSGEVRKKTS